MLDFEKQFYNEKIEFIAGCDEAGRGPLAGPVVCAAVVFPKDFCNEEINDSKQLSDKKRRELFNLIIKHACAYSIQIIPVEKIDEINILESSRLGMTLAVKDLNHKVDLVLTDCMKLHEVKDKPVIDIIKGDAKALCIAAASILAKVTRDNIMEELDEKYPMYGFKENKGYGTKSHMDALEKYGPVKGLHRFSYKPIQKFLQVKLF